MLDHINIPVPPSRLEEVTNWYLAALAPLGYSKQLDYPGIAVGLGPDKNVLPFWISAKADASPSTTHIAFRCADHATVDKFHEEGLRAGGKCNGKPGLRLIYHPKYYAAFVFDPLGNNIEVVSNGLA